MRLRHALAIAPSKVGLTLSDDALVTFAPMESIADGAGGIFNAETKSFGELSNGSYNFFAEGDVLLAKVTPCFENGKKAIASDLSNGVGFATSEVHVLRPDRRRINDRYLSYLFSSAPFISNGVATMTGAGGLRRISERAVLDYELPVGDVGEQRRIADVLDKITSRIDALIASKRRLSAVLLEREEGTFLQAITGFNRSGPKFHSGSAWIGEIPSHWSAPKMVHVARQETGHTPSRKVDEYWVPGECVIPWFSLADVWQIRQGGRIEVSETSERISELGMANSAARLLPADTVILSRTASVGFPAILAVPMAVTQDFVGWVCGPKILPRYLYYVLRAMKPVFRSLMIGSTHQTIYMPDIRSFRTPLPPIEEQAEIIAMLDRTTGAFRAAAAEINRSISLLVERREAAITAGVSGHQPARAAPAAPVALRTACAAEIIHRHRTVLRFGRVKLQKLLYLAETHLEIDGINGRYEREAAGPLDRAMLDEVEADLLEQDLYRKDGADRGGVNYVALSRAGQHDADLQLMIPEKVAALRDLIALLRDLDTRATEMVTTLYAVWNDDLIDGRQVSDDAIVEGVLEEWHPEKRVKFTAADLHHWLAWMKRNGLTPRGSGPRSIATMPKDLFVGSDNHKKGERR